jgi:hypothetical protein
LTLSATLLLLVRRFSTLAVRDGAADEEAAVEEGPVGGVKRAEMEVGREVCLKWWCLDSLRWR